MNFMLLIHHGSTATPQDADAWGQLSEDEQKAVYAERPLLERRLAELDGPTVGDAP